jgi:hypothetical protein
MPSHNAVLFAHLMERQEVDQVDIDSAALWAELDVLEELSGIVPPRWENGDRLLCSLAPGVIVNVRVVYVFPGGDTMLVATSWGDYQRITVAQIIVDGEG